MYIFKVENTEYQQRKVYAIHEVLLLFNYDFYGYNKVLLRGKRSRFIKNLFFPAGWL